MGKEQMREAPRVVVHSEGTSGAPGAPSLSPGLRFLRAHVLRE